MFKFIHAADIHLDSPLLKLGYYEGAPVEELRGATRRAFENLVDLAVAESVAFVLIAGDLYDGDWRDYNTGLYFVSRMGRLREAGIRVFIVAGNHDAENRMTRTLRLPETVCLLSASGPETVVLEGAGVAIHGQSFPSPAVKRNLASGYPSPRAGYFNIGLLHTCATGREGHEPYAPCTMDDLRSKGYDYWALGHVHRQEMLLDDPLVLFPGNTQGRHIRESGPKGCMLVTVDDKGRASAEFKPLDVIRWVRVEHDASGADSAYQVLDAVGGMLSELPETNQGLPVVARVEIQGACPAHDELASDRERWTNEIRSVALDSGGGRVWVEKVRFRTWVPREKDRFRASEGPVGELLRYLEELRDSPRQLTGLGESLSDLMKKLPREFKEGPDAIRVNDEAWLADLLNEIRPILLDRLMRKGEHQ